MLSGGAYGDNNGATFAGYTGFIQPPPGNLGAHGIAFADIAGGLAMTLGRFAPILFVPALAGSLAARRTAPLGLGTLRTDTATFVVFLVGFVIDFALLNSSRALPRAAGSVADVPPVRLIASARHLHRICMRFA